MLKQRGLSLVELMISITLGLILMAGVIQMFVGSKATFYSQQAMSRVQETGRLALEFISRDVRMAGYMGCPTRSQLGNVSITSTLNSPTSFSWDYLTGVQGYKIAAVSDADYVMLSSLSGSNGEAITPLLNTDLIQIVSASGNGTPITIAKDATSFNTKQVTPIANGCGTGKARFNGLCEGDILVATDCVASKVFQATSITSDGTDLDIVHGAASGSMIGNSVINWGGPASTDYAFPPGAEIVQMQKMVYYIKNNTAGEPTLWQWLNGKNNEVVEGVENLSFTYGRDTNNDNVPDTYDTAATVGTNWAQVKSVRIEILVRSAEELLPEAQSYSFPMGAASVKATDKRLRQVFSTTVGIRSRLQ
jgi:type IV pilus assembly protein PilW